MKTNLELADLIFGNPGRQYDAQHCMHWMGGTAFRAAGILPELIFFALEIQSTARRYPELRT
jgi:hypothetical protein